MRERELGLMIWQLAAIISILLVVTCTSVEAFRGRNEYFALRTRSCERTVFLQEALSREGKDLAIS